MTAKVNKTQKVRRTIGAQQYLFSRTAYGWGVAPAGKKGDMSRTYRGYNVYVNDRGEPTRCSCPDYTERSKRGPHICKHMFEVGKMLEEQKAALDAKYPTPDLNEMAAALCPDDRIGRSGQPKPAPSIRLPVVSTRRLRYNKASRTFSAEASDLKDVLPRLPREFALESHRTGREVRVRHFHTEREPHGDVVYDEYQVVPEDRPAVDGGDFRVVLYND